MVVLSFIIIYLYTAVHFGMYGNWLLAVFYSTCAMLSILKMISDWRQRNDENNA